MKIYIVLADWGAGDQVEGCFKFREDAEERIGEVKDSAYWYDIQEHDLID